MYTDAIISGGGADAPQLVAFVVTLSGTTLSSPRLSEITVLRWNQKAVPVSAMLSEPRLIDQNAGVRIASARVHSGSSSCLEVALVAPSSSTSGARRRPSGSMP